MQSFLYFYHIGILKKLGDDFDRVASPEKKRATEVVVADLVDDPVKTRGRRLVKVGDSVKKVVEGKEKLKKKLVGDRARRNIVLLMDKDIAEVFYSKVSDFGNFFYCLDAELEFVNRTRASVCNPGPEGM
ncbi:hypothetical protein RYX36_010620 [Vicia faba]